MKSFATLLDITGQTFSRLTVIKRAEDYKNGSARWLCRCSCGKDVVVIGQKLRNGRTRSCGCLSLDLKRKRSTIHGDSGTRLFRIWSGMLNRCLNEHNSGWKNYGGRGIGVCKEWSNSFVEFKSWSVSNGYKDELTIDRIDNDLGYAPWNCRWVSAKAQGRNKRTNARLPDGSLAYDVIAETGISPAQYRTRVRSGMSPELAAKTPHLRPRALMPDGRIAVDVAAENGIKAGTFNTRIKVYGWDVVSAATTPVRHIR